MAPGVRAVCRRGCRLFHCFDGVPAHRADPARLDARRAAIVTAAADLLADEGYTGCSVAAVAARAGVATGTVHNHFEGKTKLLSEVFRTMVTREVDAVRRASQAGRAVERITAAIETFAGRALKNPRRAYALLAEPVDPVIEELH